MSTQRSCQLGTHLDDAEIVSVLAVGSARLFEHGPHVCSRLSCLGDARCVCIVFCGVDGKAREGDGAGGWQLVDVGRH